MIELMEYLLSRLTLQEMELFFVQAWLIWTQRNKLLHGGKIQDQNWLCKRAVEFLEEYRASQNYLNIDGVVPVVGEVCKTPLASIFKLNFDAAVFRENQRIGFGAILRNDKGEAMAAMTVVRPPVSNSEEAELLASRKAMEFATDA